MPISTLGPNALASSSVTRPKIGYAGAVLQVYTAYDGTGGSTTSTSRVNLSATAATITPTSTSSKIVICVNFGATLSAGGSGINAYGYFDISEGSTAVTSSQSLNVISGSGTNVQISAPCTITITLANSSLTARSFYLYGYRTGGSSTLYAYYIDWSIMEVAV